MKPCYLCKGKYPARITTKCYRCRHSICRWHGERIGLLWRCKRSCSTKADKGEA